VASRLLEGVVTSRNGGVGCGVGGGNTGRGANSCAIDVVRF
ncbi:MAG: hypothetical protein FD143_3624, partial [Ignavibacteria bacterium]